MDDRALLDRLRLDDQAAFDSIFRAHYAPLVAFAHSMLRDHAVAEDVAQEVMLQLWRRRHDLTIQESLRAYLLRATRNRSLNQLRHAKVQQRAEPKLVDDDLVPEVGAANLVANELREAFTTAVSELPPGCREIFHMSRGQGLKYSEIASTLGISVKTVESQMGKALRHLRARLAAWLPKGKQL